MSEQSVSARDTGGRIGKQVMLPWSKAIEIAAKSVQVRFWRSMITMSSIVLAIAFLMSIWTSTAIVASLGTGPGKDLGVLKAKLKTLRDAGDDAAKRQAVVQELPRDVAAGAAAVAEAIDDLNDELEDAKKKDEKTKLQAQIDELQALLKPAATFDLLEHHLTNERARMQRVKGEVDAILQQERSGDSSATTAIEGDEPDASEPKPAPTGGGLLTDFLSQMTPTDKWLAILALLVCFVGIVNAMFMTVQERFREIGTMKCLGALDAFIVKIFLIESAALGLLGTIFGILVGLLLSMVRQLFVYGKPSITYFPLGNIVLAGVMAAVIGLVLSVLAAIFPARQAARMEPVEAMRTEE